MNSEFMGGPYDKRMVLVLGETAWVRQQREIAVSDEKRGTLLSCSLILCASVEN